MEITSKDSELQTFSDLYPYTEYTFFIQCSLTDCETGWGLVSGPVTGRTDEESENFIKLQCSLSNFNLTLLYMT